jgi:hypothetical protein
MEGIDMASKGLNIKVGRDDISYTSISKSKEGYSSAFVGVKMGDDAYMSVNVEWRGDAIPDVVMDMMGFIQSNEKEIAEAIEANKEGYETYKNSR